MRYLRVPNFDELQHYKQRNPPWIKLYRRLLKENDFLSLSEQDQWVLVRIWLVAAEDHPGGFVPNDEAFLRRAIGSLRPVPLKRLVETGWLEPCDEKTLVENTHSAITDASGPASTVAIKQGEKTGVSCPPEEQRSRKDLYRESSTSTTDPAPVYTTTPVERLIEAVKPHGDAATPATIRKLAAGLPDASVARVTESLGLRTVTNRAQYASAALQSERIQAGRARARKDAA